MNGSVWIREKWEKVAEILSNIILREKMVLKCILFTVLQLGKAFGVESFILDPAETKKLYPLLNVDDLCGSLYSPADGTIDPASYCSSLTRGATKKGAKVWIQQGQN